MNGCMPNGPILDKGPKDVYIRRYLRISIPNRFYVLSVISTYNKSLKHTICNNSKQFSNRDLDITQGSLHENIILNSSPESGSNPIPVLIQTHALMDSKEI